MDPMRLIWGAQMMRDGEAAKLTIANGRNWPGPGFLGDRSKLTLAGRAIAPKVSFPPSPRTHTGSQKRT
jgi:hypothetical protein